MKLHTVLSAYQKTENYQLKNELKQQIFDDLSSTEMSEKEFNETLAEGNGIRYAKMKLSLSERDRRQIYSEAIRLGVADNAARILSTRQFALEDYEGLKTLLDYSCTKQAEEKNQVISDTLLKGNTRAKSQLFHTLTNSVLEVSPTAFFGSSDERLVLEWKELGTKLYQCTILSQMVKEAKELGIKVSPDRERAFQVLEKKSEMPYKLLASRAGMMANPYYSIVNADDLLKLKPEALKSVKVPDQKLKNYLEDICGITENYKDNIREQIKERLENMGYSSIRQVRFGDKLGNDYENKEIMGILLKGRPVYILSEEGGLKGVLKVADREGFMIPTSEEYRLFQHAETTLQQEKTPAAQKSVSEKKNDSVSPVSLI